MVRLRTIERRDFGAFLIFAALVFLISGNRPAFGWEPITTPVGACSENIGAPAGTATGVCGEDGTRSGTRDDPPLEVVDGPNGNSYTRYQSIHVCPEGFALRGVLDDRRKFLCAAMPETDTDYFVDYGSTRGAVRGCPYGTYIRGIAEGSSDADTAIVCAFDKQRGYTEFEGPEYTDRCAQDRKQCVQDNGGHLCAAGGVIIAFQSTNEFICRSVAETSDSLTDSLKPDADPLHDRSFRNLSRSLSLEDWQAMSRNWLSRILNISPKGPPLSLPFERFPKKTKTTNGVMQEYVKYPSPVDGQMIEAWISYPPNYDPEKKYPAVFVTHGHLTDVTDAALPGHSGSSDHAIAYELARGGAITLAAEVRGLGWFDVPGRHAHYADILPPGRYPQYYMSDNLMNVSQLLSIPGADPDRTAVVGLSLGGYQSLWLGAMDTRLRKVVVAGLFLSQACLNNPGRHHWCQTIPSIEDRDDHSALIDTDDLAALIAPRSLLVTWGRSDLFYKFNPNKGCRIDAADKTKEIFSNQNIPDRFTIAEFDGGHEIDVEDTVKWVLDTPFY